MSTKISQSAGEWPQNILLVFLLALCYNYLLNLWRIDITNNIESSNPWTWISLQIFRPLISFIRVFWFWAHFFFRISCTCFVGFSFYFLSYCKLCSKTGGQGGMVSKCSLLLYKNVLGFFRILTLYSATLLISPVLETFCAFLEIFCIDNHIIWK